MAPPRRTHTKSRNGCLQCKKRRVKCDEIGPPCTNCATRGTSCEYPTPASQRTNRLVPSNTDSQSPASVVSSTETIRKVSSSGQASADGSTWSKPSTNTAGLSLSPATRYQELELMHRWSTSTYLGFKPKKSEVFQGYVVQEGLRHEYLMESILALAALHIASEKGDAKSAEPYINIALQYQTSAVPALRAALLQITPSNCDAIFAASILTMVCTIVSPLIPSTDPQKTSPTESLSLLFDFIKGITTIVEISRSWLERGPFEELIQDKRNFNPQDSVIEVPMKRLKDLNDSVMAENKALHQVYENAIKHLAQCFREDQTMGIPWLVMVGEEFMIALRQKESMALLIFMHWGVFLDQVDDMWWASYSGKKLVEELSGSLLGNGKEWDEATNWAKVQVGL